MSQTRIEDDDEEEEEEEEEEKKKKKKKKEKEKDDGRTGKMPGATRPCGAAAWRASARRLELARRGSSRHAGSR